MVYIPERGDAVWIDFNPQVGREQAGSRPALIVSPAAYNRKVRLALFCPITNKVKGYPFEVLIPNNLLVTGVILSDQVKSLDWKIRRAELITRMPSEVIDAVSIKIRALLP